ncbi:MAG: hypothetical protein H0X39_18615 [Actinobacteria bacterium]|nr:hypothetical protein [Actinomycetota bacterium]
MTPRVEQSSRMIVDHERRLARAERTPTARRAVGRLAVKAGTPADADWTAAGQLVPPVGTMVLDTSGSRLWVKTLATAGWKSTVLA